LGLDRRTLYRKLERYEARNNRSADPPPSSVVHAEGARDQ